MPLQQEEIERIVEEFIKDVDSEYYEPMDLLGNNKCIVDWLRTTLSSLTEAHKVEMEKVERAMFTKIKNDITKLQYDTDGDTFKKIVLSRLSSPEWFEAITKEV